jgi:DNA-binding response OmpR family regulator
MSNITTPKIFIVEDEPFFANLINFDLESKNYTDTKVFFTGEDCIANLHLNPDIVLLDHKLPGLSGLEVLKKIKAHNPETHVIFLSGATGAEIQISAFKYGAEDFILKSENSFDEVKELLNEFVNNKNGQSVPSIKKYPNK